MVTDSPMSPSPVEYLDFQEGMGVKEEFGFGRFYSTGAAICLIMDKLDIDWKGGVEDGASPAEVMAKSLQASSLSEENIGKSNEWKELLQKGKELARQAAGEEAVF